jgi:hypothetical protein
MKLKQIRLGLSNPKLFGRKVSQIYNYTRAGVEYNPNGIDVMQQDWDNLLLLDACRYDLFEEENDIPGNLRSVESRGAATPEFLRGNFDGKEFLDTVYVTTNPMLYRHQDELDVKFHSVINLWTGDTWNDEYGTVLPEVVTAESKRVAEEYPNKRLLIHYMQPHYPFIESDTAFDKGHVGVDSPDELTTWMQVLTGNVEIDKSALWNSYADNLQRALPYVEELIEQLSGKSVITSDHGNMFGEISRPIPIREWGHPEGIWTEELVRVPWLEIDSDNRKRIFAGVDHEESNINDSDVAEKRLESLGYLDA